MIRSLAELTADLSLMEPPDCRVPPCGVAGRVSLVCLGPKGGKSSTVAAMVAQASQAGVRCLLLTLDEALADSVQRLVRYGAHPDTVFLANVFDQATLAADITRLGVGFVAVDHLGKLAEGHKDFGPGSAGDAVLWGRLVAPFTLIARTHDVAIVLLDQARRSDGRYAGSTAKAGSVDYIVELEEKDGGLAATPKGRTYLPPFRADLDGDGVPVFTIKGTGHADPTPDFADLTANALTLLRTLSDTAPEGLPSTKWWKLSGIGPEMNFQRARMKLVRDGLALEPEATRTRRYRITPKGEAFLAATTTTATMLLPVVASGSPTTPTTSHRMCVVGSNLAGEETVKSPGSATVATALLPVVVGGSSGSNLDRATFLAQLDAEVRGLKAAP